MGAFWAVWSHFSCSHEPALVSLPTGAGKTALMIALSFGLKARRVLVVTPAEILRDQTADEFRSLRVFLKMEALPNDIERPKVLSNSSQLTTLQKWQDLAAFDVVTATPKTVSPAESGVSGPPKDLFDLVFIDEAHHTPANTWTALLDAFATVKCVLLTATPFRRDGRRIRAALAYHYPIGKALDAGIYRPVKYHPVTATTGKDRDRALAKAAGRLFKKEKALGNNAKVLIRVNRVDKSDRLRELYDHYGIRIAPIDYTKTWNENQTILEAVKKSDLDGIVCVGMLGEGLDLPQLKIAVLHSAPQSLPFTVQFIGRVSRFDPAQSGDAHLLSVPEDVRGEMRRLHKADANWRRLIPRLVDEVVGPEVERRQFHSPDPFEELDININDLDPFLSVRAFKVGSNTDLTRSLELPEDVGISFYDATDRLVTLITGTQAPPIWAKETAILETKFELHLFWCDQSRKLLFESTTSPMVANGVREIIAPEAEQLETEELMRTMQIDEFGDYLMVGLRSVSGIGPAQPAYKTLMGKEVQAAVRPSDKSFSPGHALVRAGSGETRGIGTLASRIWSVQRTDVKTFIKWCNTLAIEITKTAVKPGLPQLRFLSLPQAISALPERPLTVLSNHELIGARQSIVAFRDDGAGNRTDTITGDVEPEIAITAFKKGTGVLECQYNWHSSSPGIAIRYSAASLFLWEVGDERTIEIQVELADSTVFEGTLTDFLSRFPPTFVMPGGGVVVRREFAMPSGSPGPLPKESTHVPSWQGCDRKAETEKPKPGSKTIHDWLEEKLTASTTSEVIVKDHGSGEIADFIVVSKDQQRRSVWFYHCKGMKGARPSDRVTEAYEVLGQAIRSASWVATKKLLEELYGRTNSAGRGSRLVKGNRTFIKSLADNFRSNEWDYYVVVVQPGFKCSSILSSGKVQGLVTSAYEWITNAGATFVIWGS